MQRIDSLLKQVITHKKDTASVVELIFSITGIQIQDKDVVFSSTREGIQKVELHISGAQKTKLVLMKDELEKKLKQMQITLVL